MAEVFQYINSMYCIRDEPFNPIRDANVIATTDMTSIHKSILTKAYDDGNTNALLFQNELFFTRQIGDVNNNEIKRFLGTNSTWDVLIMSPRTDLALLPVATYTHVHRVDRTDFIIDKVYLVSRRFMQKVKENTLSNVETYFYDNTFVNAASTVSTQHRVKVGKVQNVQLLATDVIKYVWTPFSI